MVIYGFTLQMYALYKDPMGETIFTQNTVNQLSTGAMEAMANKEKIHNLERRLTMMQEQMKRQQVSVNTFLIFVVCIMVMAGSTLLIS